MLDNVFSPQVCQQLNELASEHSYRSSDGSSYFLRGNNNNQEMRQTQALTPLECALESVLQLLGDDNEIVEYWSRIEYINMDAHVDIDEEALVLEKDNKERGATKKETKSVDNDDKHNNATPTPLLGARCPEWGHVLYLQVQEGLLGPTCVFPTSSSSSLEGGVDNNPHLWTVPAVPGRLLRFPGASLHAVPKPHNRWLLSKEEEQRLHDEDEQDYAKYSNDDDNDDEEDWDDNGYFDDDDYDEDDEDDDEPEVERAVILFNTWSLEKGPPPLTIEPDPIVVVSEMPEGIAISDDDDSDDNTDSFVESQRASQFSTWEQNYGKNGEKVACQPRSAWKPCTVTETPDGLSNMDENDDDDQHFPSLRVRLMGDKTRRLQRPAMMILQGPTMQQISQALESDSQPTAFALRTVETTD